MTNALASVNKSMYASVASRELAKITSNYPTENIFYTDGSMIDDVSWIHGAQQKLCDRASTGETVFSAEISEISWQYLILSGSSGSFMAMRSRRITSNAHP
jgi:hypothetical protein